MNDDEGWTIRLVDSAGAEITVLDLTPEDFGLILRLGITHVIRRGMNSGPATRRVG
jgi:hypothetical protein